MPGKQHVLISRLRFLVLSSSCACPAVHKPDVARFACKNLVLLVGLFTQAYVWLEVLALA